MKSKFKIIVPYLLLGATIIGPSATKVPDNTQTEDKKIKVFTPVVEPIRYIYEEEYKKNSFYLENKADSLCNAYIQNMLDAQQKLKPLMGTRRYARAVREELPGAPVGQHCMYGQFTHLMRALDEMGDTLTIIPEDAKMACINFKHYMREKYAQTPSCIHEGVMHKSDSAYNTALDRYLRAKNVTINTDDSIRKKHIARFAEKNFNADAIAPGAIMIVPRYRGSKNTFHAIMFLGRGRVENGIFIPDSTAQHIYVGHNRENIGDLFRTFDTTNVFAANTKNIALAEYRHELKKIESMSDAELIQYLMPMQQLYFEYVTHDMLLHMARNKYFNQPLITDKMKFHDFISTTMLNVKFSEFARSNNNQKTL